MKALVTLVDGTFFEAAVPKDFSFDDPLDHVQRVNQDRSIDWIPISQVKFIRFSVIKKENT